MKRIIVGLLAAFLTMAGLVAVSSSPATAACPYTNCVRTSINTEGPQRVRIPNLATFKVGVRAAGNVRPTGTVRFTVYRQGKPGIIFQFEKTLVGTNQSNLSRTKFTVRSARLSGAGFYKLVFKYTPSANSTFQPVKTDRVLRVLPRR